MCKEPVGQLHQCRVVPAPADIQGEMASISFSLFMSFCLRCNINREIKTEVKLPEGISYDLQVETKRHRLGDECGQIVDTLRFLGSAQRAVYQSP